MLMALVAVFLTELLSPQVAITLASSSQSNFQCLLWSGSCMADLAGALHRNSEWCICSAAPFFLWHFSTDFSSSVPLCPIQLGCRWWDGLHQRSVLTYSSSRWYNQNKLLLLYSDNHTATSTAFVTMWLSFQMIHIRKNSLFCSLAGSARSSDIC